MQNRILVVVEGDDTEKRLFDNIKNVFFKNKEDSIIVTAFCNNVYELYKVISDDEDLDLFELVKEMPENSHLEDLKIKQVSEIYLFFDYDAHDSKASNDDLAKMLNIFSEETDLGKLYINYPMIESFRDYDEVHYYCKTCLFDLASKVHYKTIVGGRGNCDNFTKYNFTRWKILIESAMKKIQCLFNDDVCDIEGVESIDYSEYANITQMSLFHKQLERYVIPYNKVMIISSVPLFLVDYFGLKLYNSCAK